MKNAPNPETLKTNLSQAKVLIIEDNNDHWLLMRHAMQKCLAEVTPFRVATLDEALSQLHEWQYQEWEYPKLILLDLYVPDSCDGWELLQAIKELPAPLSHIPIVMFSSSEETADIMKAYKLGASSYLIKPVNVGDWLAYFKQLRAYWWETAILPRPGYNL